MLLTTHDSTFFKDLQSDSKPHGGTREELGSLRSSHTAAFRNHSAEGNLGICSEFSSIPCGRELHGIVKDLNHKAEEGPIIKSTCYR